MLDCWLPCRTNLNLQFSSLLVAYCLLSPSNYFLCYRVYKSGKQLPRESETQAKKESRTLRPPPRPLRSRVGQLRAAHRKLLRLSTVPTWLSTVSALLFVYASENVHVCHLPCNNFYSEGHLQLVARRRSRRRMRRRRGRRQRLHKSLCQFHIIAPVFSLAFI